MFVVEGKSLVFNTDTSVKTYYTSGKVTKKKNCDRLWKIKSCFDKLNFTNHLNIQLCMKARICFKYNITVYTYSI